MRVYTKTKWNVSLDARLTRGETHRLLRWSWDPEEEAAASDAKRDPPICSHQQ